MTAPNFKINNNSIPDPTELSWNLPDVKGIDGFGNKRYDPYFSFELKYNYMSPTDFYSGIYMYWLGHYLSGSAVVVLPKFNDGTYQFVEYSGTVIDKPEFSSYTNNFVKDVKIVIRKIRVE